jgi:hypothetical protein
MNRQDRDGHAVGGSRRYGPQAGDGKAVWFRVQISQPSVGIFSRKRIDALQVTAANAVDALGTGNDLSCLFQAQAVGQ